MNETHIQRVWTVAQAKAKLSEILRLAESEGPQRIGTRRPFVRSPGGGVGGEETSGQTVGPVARRERASGHESRSPGTALQPPDPLR